jgi:hypothetical protein
MTTKMAEVIVTETSTNDASLPFDFFHIVLAWDGVDSDTGGSVEIGEDNLGRSGSSIEVSGRATSESTSQPRLVSL